MGSGERMASSDRIGEGRQLGTVGATSAARGVGHVGGSMAGGSVVGSSVGGSSSVVGSVPAAGATSPAPRARASALVGTVRIFTDRPQLERRLKPELERHGYALEAALPATFPEAIEARSVVVIDAGASSYDADEVLAHVGLAKALGAWPVVALPATGAGSSPGSISSESDAGIGDIDELVDDLCGGLVLRTDADVPRIAAALARRASALSSARFEYLTVSPRVSRRRATRSTAGQLLSPTGAGHVTAAGSVSAAGNVSAAGSISAAGNVMGAGSSAGELEAISPPPLLAIFADTSCALVDRPVTLDDDGSDVIAITIAEDAESARIELASGRELVLGAGEAWTRSVRSSTPEGRSLSAAEILAQIDGPTLGARIRTLRLGAGLTQAELARRTGIHRPNIARVEAGRHTPSLETIARLAAAIGVPATRVLEG